MDSSDSADRAAHHAAIRALIADCEYTRARAHLAILHCSYDRECIQRGVTAACLASNELLLLIQQFRTYVLWPSHADVAHPEPPDPFAGL